MLVDAGDGISRALLANHVPFKDINGILLSHLHPDHFSGLGALLVQMKLTNRENTLDIFVNQKVMGFVKKFVRQSYIFIEKMGFEINYKTFRDGKKTNVDKEFSFYSKQNSHLDKYKQYVYAGRLRFSCNSFLFEGNAKSFFYTGDIGTAKDLYLFEDYKFNAMITEISHVPADDIMDAFIQQKAKILVLTHISDEDQDVIAGLYRRPEAIGKHNIVTAVDGDVIEIL